MSETNKPPSVSVIRPVINFGIEELARFKTELETNGLAVPELEIAMIDNSNRGHGLRATILSDGELRMVQQSLGIEPSEYEADGVAEFLNDSLPRSFDEEVRVATLPASVHTNRRRTQADRRMLLLGNSNKSVIEERNITQELIKGFYRVAAQGEPITILENDWLASVNVANARGKTAPDIMNNLISFVGNNPDLFPVELVLGPTEIEDV